MARSTRRLRATCAALRPAADEVARRPPSAAELAELREQSASAWAAHRARPRPAGSFRSWVNGGAEYSAADCARDAQDADLRVDFDTDGFLHLRAFASPAECADMIERMRALVGGWDPETGELVGFNTRAKEQEEAQGSSDYFLDSADRIHFFAEPDAIDDRTGRLAPGLDKLDALNKVGHGLHLLDPTFRSYAQSPRLSNLLQQLGWRAPVLPQSMYIFKNPRIGGETTSHQDSCFLYTTPRQTCVGLWLALHPATLSNGCLWVRPGSHTEGLRRQSVRNPAYFDSEMAADADADGAASAQGQPRPQMVFRDQGPTDDSPAAEWEGAMPSGSWPPPCAGLFGAGFLPVECEAGDLMVFAGELDHLSLPNFSDEPRHTFQLHAIEGPSAGVEWSPDNWLQYADGRPFPTLGDGDA